MKHPVIMLFCALILIISICGCAADSDGANTHASDNKGKGGSSDTDTDSDSDADSGADSDSDSDSDSDVCDEQDFSIEYNPTRLMILLDNSGSMDSGGLGQDTKWVQAKKALITLLNTWSGTGQIEFGFDVFPDFECSGFCCDVSHPVVEDCKLNNEANLISIIQNAPAPPGEFDTPLCDGMDMFNNSSYAQRFTAPGANRYLLVVSDGQEECNGAAYTEKCGSAPAYAGAVTIVSNLLSNGIKTFVIGFGSGVDPTQLNVIAREGETGFDNYFIATNQAQLQQAFESIASSVLSCEFTLDEPDATADPDKVNFYFDDVVVPYDEDCAQDTGWSWTDDAHKSVTFCEASCRKIQDGEVDTVSAKFGCPSVPID